MGYKKRKNASVKTRITVTIDKEIEEKLDLYIDNLSGFINKVLKNYVEYCEKELEKDDTFSKLPLCHFSAFELASIENEELREAVIEAQDFLLNLIRKKNGQKDIKKSHYLINYKQDQISDIDELIDISKTRWIND